MSAGYLLRKDDYPEGIATAADVQKLAALLNPYLTQLNALSAQGVTFSDNVSCEVQVGKFKHGVASQFTLKSLKAAKGCVVLGCDSAIVQGVVMQPVQDLRPNAQPRVSVTIWFNNAAMTGAKVGLLFTPEGQLCTSVPTLVGDTTWTNVSSFLNSWANLGGAALPAGYRKDANGRVWLRGTIHSGTINTSAFTLPSGYRPSGAISMMSVSYSSAAAAAGLILPIAITTAGDVIVGNDVNGSNFQSELNGISFDTL